MKCTGHRGVDAVLEASGNIEAVNSAIGIIKPKGTMTLIGFFERTLDGFPIDQHVLNAGILNEVNYWSYQ